LAQSPPSIWPVLSGRWVGGSGLLQSLGDAHGVRGGFAIAEAVEGLGGADDAVRGSGRRERGRGRTDRARGRAGHRPGAHRRRRRREDERRRPRGDLPSGGWPARRDRLASTRRPRR
jgi:hypothetical protein